MEIKADHFKLRPLRQGDEFSLADNANNEKLWNNVRDYFPHPYTIEDARAWIALNENQQPLTHFAIDIDGLAVGSIGINLKDDVYKCSAEIGFWLGENYWNQKIMSNAVNEVVDYTFSTFDVVRIYASVFEFNHASMKVLERAGFRQEAMLRFAIIKHGTLMDEYIYSILRL
ncbi:GNAT family N-acetyltransferase [Solitalea koreensis]|uniref:Protein N-acetyltransferase, RimJ/RimL family n=1 Tax=Solitalea koreensis TaxID=543615 RepID=A0A521AZW6_9SPHI|nr:GNAT family protein [Solitalea koreensis]SMO40070.1 Protein N-acetyltransferase, RimJ/RimL family [Solitalea koreensis]